MKHELTPEQILQKACAYCAQAEHCEQEVKEKLRQWGLSDNKQQQQIIDYLFQENFLNEERYCHAFVHDKVKYQSWGKLKIKAMLQAKHLPANLIQQALNNINEKDYEEALRKAIGKYGETDPDRTLRFAMQRGFSYDEIKSHIQSR